MLIFNLNLFPLYTIFEFLVAFLHPVTQLDFAYTLLQIHPGNILVLSDTLQNIFHYAFNIDTMHVEIFLNNNVAQNYSHILVAGATVACLQQRKYMQRHK